MAILDINNLTVQYGFIKAVNAISLKVEKGKMVALLGANGAGKTSVLNTISGLVKPASGSEIILNGHNIAGKRAFKVSSMGLSLCPEGRQIFTGLSVEENLKAGAYALKATTRIVVDENGVEKKVKISARQRTKENFDRVYKLFPILLERKFQQAQTLSGGEQQMLAVARALMSSPDVLLLDEPSLGLAPLIIKDIFDTLVEIRSQGTTILIVEQNALATLKIADYAYVMELGKIAFEGPAQELIHNEKLIDAYLGGKKD